MKLVKFGSLKDVSDGDKFLVVAPNGNVFLCWWSQRGYFSPEIDYVLVQDFGNYECYETIPYNENTLVCKIEVEE